VEESRSREDSAVSGDSAKYRWNVRRAPGWRSLALDVRKENRLRFVRARNARILRDLLPARVHSDLAQIAIILVVGCGVLRAIGFACCSNWAPMHTFVMVRLSWFGDKVASRLRDGANLLDLGIYAGKLSGDCKRWIQMRAALNGTFAMTAEFSSTGDRRGKKLRNQLYAQVGGPDQHVPRSTVWYTVLTRSFQIFYVGAFFIYYPVLILPPSLTIAYVAT
jgi:hypothetical protein